MTNTSHPVVVRPAALDWVKFDAHLARNGDVDPVDKALYAALASFVDQGSREATDDPDSDNIPTRRRLAACIGRSVKTVDRATARLEERGLLEVERRRDPDNPMSNLPSAYKLLDQAGDWKKRLSLLDSNSARDHQSFVYLVGTPGSPVAKIGVTRKLAARVRGLQNASSEPVELLWRTQGDRRKEAWLHGQFHNLRMHGEWFNFGDLDPVATVANMAAQFDGGEAK